MDSIDLDILKFMSERENHQAYKDTITKNLCTKESWLLVGDMGRFFEENPQTNEITSDFKLWFRVTGHPGWKIEEHQLYGTIIDNVLATETPNRRSFLSQLERTRFVSQVGLDFDSLRSGTICPSEFGTNITKYSETVGQSSNPTPAAYSLDDVATYQRSNQGLFFRLEDLNQSIGPLRKGDFVIIGKRPEIGGTSFLASEMSFMLEQMAPGSNAVLFHNEEAPSKVFTRMVSTALDVDYKTMMTAHAHYQQQYDAWLGDKTWELVHDTNMGLGSIHSKLKEKDYGLIGINVLLKVGETGQKEDHDKFQALGEECRRISQLHGPVLAVVQADPSAEGMRFIPQDRIYKSKTALQGEADALIMIGKDDDVPDNLRYINVAKNKIPPAPCTDLAVKHIKSEVEFDIATGRFKSLNYVKHSRSKAFGNTTPLAATSMERSTDTDGS